MHQLYVCVTTQHDRNLLFIAAILCALGSYTSVVLARQASEMRDPGRRLRWALGTVLSATSAIWATHFIAMLAFRVAMPSGFQLAPTIASFFIALLMVGIATQITIATRLRHAAVISGVIIGLAISAMHYVGMSAFRVVGTIEWDMAAVAVSIAVGVSCAVFACITSPRGRSHGVWLPTMLFTLAICGDHFIAMSAATIAYDPRVVLPTGLIGTRNLALLVAAVATLVIGLASRARWQHRKRKRRQAVQKQQLQQLTDVAVEGLAVCEGGRIVWINSSLEQMLTGSRLDHVGLSIDDLLFTADLDALEHNREIDARLRVGDGDGDDQFAPVRVITRPMQLEGRPHVVVAIRDQRERLLAEAEMNRLATRDALTGLANRASFNAVLAAMFAAPMGRSGNFALLAIDLDRFKSVNDVHGHAAGDAVLVGVAQRLRSLVRDADLVARLGGDEFSIIAAKGNDFNEITFLARRIIESIGRPFAIDGRIHQIGASVGVAFAVADGRDAETLTRAADLALYRAKEEGRGVHRFFEASMQLRMQERNSLEQALRQALGNGELRVHYQPQVHARTGVFNGAEALVRWMHPTRGLVSPADFIPLAEETNLIAPIGEWVLRTACREAVTWPDHLVVAVNLSPVQFRDPALAALVRTVLEDSGLPGHRLELEITEGVLIDEETRVRGVFDELKQLGIRISLDDFGTGYSSLSSLRKFPFDKIKIDRSFVNRVTEDRDSRAVLHAVVALGAGLGLTTTAEGVETEAQRRFVADAGCDQIQGYLYGRPVMATALPVEFHPNWAEPEDVAGPVEAMPA